MNRMITIGALALAFVAGALWWLNAAPSRSGAALLPGALNAQEAGDDPGDIDTSSVVEMALGPEDAKVTVIEYASFTCPHCARFHADQFQKLKRDYIDTGKVRFVFRDVYFDRYGLWAAMVARCGGRERFFGIVDLLFTRQRDWIGDGKDPVAVADRLRRIGKVAGLGDDQIEACLSDNDRARTLVVWYQKNAEADDVSATPTLLVNGKKYSNMPYDELKAIIDAALGE